MATHKRDDEPRPNPRGEPRHEPIPTRDTIRRQNQHAPRYQDGGREANKGPIDKHGGDRQRDEVSRPGSGEGGEDR